MRYSAPRLPFDDEISADPVVGILVKLDDDCQCGEQAAVIEAASPPHAGGLVCYSCGRHRGWLPHRAYNFIIEIINQFGRPTEPVAYGAGQHLNRRKRYEVRQHQSRFSFLQQGEQEGRN